MPTHSNHVGSDKNSCITANYKQRFQQLSIEIPTRLMHEWPHKETCHAALSVSTFGASMSFT